MSKGKLHIISLGCPKNQVDGEVMAAMLVDDGYLITPEPQAAEFILINTCAFILPAKEEAVEEILKTARYKQAGKLVRLVVTGCLPQRYGSALANELPEVDLFLGISEIPNILRHMNNLTSGATMKSRSIIRKPDFIMNADHRRLLPPGTATAYIKIADGCSNRCSYCIIPSIRGKARSRGTEDILHEARQLTANGVKEIILVAQDTTAYGKDINEKGGLRHLLLRLAEIEQLYWIRLLYTHPAHLTEDILETIAAEEKICRYLDIPIQHIDDAVLKGMNRRIESRQIYSLIEKTRSIIPGVSLRTSIITGFPGETFTRFELLLEFVRKIRFDHLGAFTYSREEGTPAYGLPARISEKEKHRRRDLIMQEQSIISWQINRSLIGSIQECIIEGKSDRADYPFYGRCRRQAPEIDGVTYFKYFKGRNPAVGEIIRCTIIDAEEYDLFAEII